MRIDESAYIAIIERASLRLIVDKIIVALALNTQVGARVKRVETGVRVLLIFSRCLFWH